MPIWYLPVAIAGVMCAFRPSMNVEDYFVVLIFSAILSVGFSHVARRGANEAFLYAGDLIENALYACTFVVLALFLGGRCHRVEPAAKCAGRSDHEAYDCCKHHPRVSSRLVAGFIEQLMKKVFPPVFGTKSFLQLFVEVVAQVALNSAAAQITRDLVKQIPIPNLGKHDKVLGGTVRQHLTRREVLIACTTLWAELPSRVMSLDREAALCLAWAYSLAKSNGSPRWARLLRTSTS